MPPPGATRPAAKAGAPAARQSAPAPKGKAPQGKAPATGDPSDTKRIRELSDRLPALRGGATRSAGSGRKHLRSFADLGWTCADPEDAGRDGAGVRAVALDLGVEGLCVTAFEGSFARPQTKAQPTMVLVKDPHAFRSLEPFSMEIGLQAAERWPNDRVLRGTHGAILLPSQIGLVEFPADHVLSGVVAKVRDERGREQRDLVLTLPTFLPGDRGQAIRDAVASSRKGSFAGVPGDIASAYFYLAPALADGAAQGELADWSREALEAGRLLVLDWGASGLEYGLVTAREAKDEGKTKTELRLSLAGTWPSLGGHRLTLDLVLQLKELLVERILAAGPSEDLVPRPLFDPRSGQVPQPPGYERAFERLEQVWEPSGREETRERALLMNTLFPTMWRFLDVAEEPRGYAPYRRLAVQHFKSLWRAAERLKRLILSDPDRYRRRRLVPWNLERMLDSPFVSHIEERSIDYPVARFLDPIGESLGRCLDHVGRRLERRQLTGPVHVALAGMQAASPLLGAAAARGRHALGGARVAPASSDPIELKSVVNRGAALLSRDRRGVDLGPVPEVLPFSVQIADCLGNVTIFSPGPLDELAVFQRRIRVEDGSPQYEFLIYESEDGTQRGPWGCVTFERPFDFTERDRAIAVDPRYGFGGEIPLLRDLRGDGGEGLRRAFDRSPPQCLDGSISFRSYAPRDNDVARRLLHFLEHGLKGEFRRKVFLLEREFPEPPRRFDYVYQRYYLSRSQELLVVREWWAPFEGGKLMRHKTLHNCQGSTEANTLLGLSWGTY